nr:hypothetical protein [Tanacetum cinerariifolium]
RVDKITLFVTSEGTGDKPGVLDVTKDESIESESESRGNDKDGSNDENDSENEGKDEENKSDDDKTPSDSENGLDSEQDSDGSESDSESDHQEYDDDEFKDDDDDDDKFEGDEDKGMDSDDVQDKKADVEMTDAEHERENLKITQEQVIEDAHVMIITTVKETEVLDASGSHSSDLASKFLKFSHIPPNDAEIVSPLDVHVHHEIARKFKKSSLSKNDSDLVPVDEEAITKGKRIRRCVKKSSTKPATCIVIREPHVETKFKRKEKVDVTRGKGIKLLSEVALTEEAQMKEVRKKSLRKGIKVSTQYSWANLEDISEDFQIKFETFLLVKLESVEGVMLVNKIPELVHVYFRDISNDEKCRIA